MPPLKRTKTAFSVSETSIGRNVPVPGKKILISFISFDLDDFKKKKKDTDFIDAFRLPDGSLPTKPSDIWRPSVAQAQLFDLARDPSRLDRQVDLEFDDYYLLYVGTRSDYRVLAKDLEEEIRNLPRAPRMVRAVNLDSIKDPFDYNEVYKELLAFSQNPDFHAVGNACYVNCSFGSTPIRNCLFLLTLAGRFGDAKQISVSPWNYYWKKERRSIKGSYCLTDPNDFRMAVEKVNDSADRNIKDKLEKGVFTGDDDLNDRLTAVIGVLKELAPEVRRKIPILLTGPTGAGKSRLAKLIKEELLKEGASFEEINCATIRGADANIQRTELFGSTKDAYTGAIGKEGLLKKADGGVLFMDEIGELPLDMQSMLLTALGTGTFSRVGSPEVREKSNFFLIAGTNRNLDEMVERGEFRLDLLNRINTWHFELRSLREILRRDPNAALDNCSRVLEQVKDEFHLLRNLTFEDDALDALLAYAQNEKTLWLGNYREFIALITRIALLAHARRTASSCSITLDIVEQEIKEARTRQANLKEIQEKLRRERAGALQDEDAPPPAAPTPTAPRAGPLLAQMDTADLSPLDLAQIAFVEGACRQSRTLRELAEKVYGRKACGNLANKGISTIRNQLTRWGLHFNKGALEVIRKDASAESIPPATPDARA